MRFGDYDAPRFTIDSDTQITAVVPEGYRDRPVVDVRVVNSDYAFSDVSAADRFTYDVPVTSTVRGLSPRRGPLSGGTSVVITGTNFSDASDVRFGDRSATRFTGDSDTQITAVSPPGDPERQVVDVRVDGEGGPGPTSPRDRFSYVPDPIGVVSHVTPAHGPRAGGTRVVITGKHLSTTGTVLFANYEATFTVDSDTQVTAVSPRAFSPDEVDVQVVNRDGVSSAATPADRFTYDPAPPPTVTAIAPHRGPQGGGTRVVITGSGFSDASRVTFGGRDSNQYRVVSDTRIVACSPGFFTAGRVDVQVVNPDGVYSARSAADRFTYVADASSALRSRAVA